MEKLCKEIYGDYTIYPCRTSTAPGYLFTNVLGLPAIQVRWCDADSNNHAPNEHLSIEEYLNGIILAIGVFQSVASV